MQALETKPLSALATLVVIEEKPQDADAPDPGPEESLKLLDGISAMGGFFVDWQLEVD